MDLLQVGAQGLLTRVTRTLLEIATQGLIDDDPASSPSSGGIAVGLPDIWALLPRRREAMDDPVMRACVFAVGAGLA